MDIFGFIEKLQKKPETARKKILALSLIAIMSAIVSLWLFSFANRAEKVDISGVAAPFSFIKEDIQNFYGYFK